MGRVICGANFPDKGAALEEPAQVVAAETDRRDQGDAGEKRRPRRADVGVGPLEEILGLEDVGAAQQDIGRQAGLQILQGGERFGKRGGQKVGRDRRTDHQVQGVFILGHEGGVAGDVHPRRIDAGLGLVEIEGGRHPCLIAAADELVGGLLARQGILGEFQPLAVGGQGQVVCRNLGNQADLHAAPGLLRWRKTAPGPGP